MADFALVASARAQPVLQADQVDESHRTGTRAGRQQGPLLVTLVADPADGAAARRDVQGTQRRPLLWRARKRARQIAEESGRRPGQGAPPEDDWLVPAATAAGPRRKRRR